MTVHYPDDRVRNRCYSYGLPQSGAIVQQHYRQASGMGEGDNSLQCWAYRASQEFILREKEVQLYNEY